MLDNKKRACYIVPPGTLMGVKMLNQQIREVIQQFRGALPAEMSALIEQGAGEISALDIVENALKPGSAVPDFALDNQHGVGKALAGYLGEGPLVLTFYRGVWCPYCNLQLKAYSDRLSEIEDAGATLVAVSPEKPNALELLQQSEAPKEVMEMAFTNVPFDVLFDDGNSLGKAFGLQFELPESHQQLLKAFNVDLEALTGNDQFVFPDPATYVVGADGLIKWAFVPNNYRKRAEVDDILNALKQLS